MLHDARMTNLIANTLTLMAISILLLAALGWLAQRPYFRINRMYIEPLRSDSLVTVSPALIKATVAGRLSGNFFFIDLNETRELIETAPWVRKAQVRRVWPNTLQVAIEEQQPLALWNQDHMINTWGEAFSANQGELAEDNVLPQLNGPPSSERLVVQRYAEIARWFAPLNLSIKEVTLSPRYAWEVTLSNGMQLFLGRDPAADVADPHGRPGALPFAERIERFVQIWPALMARLNGRELDSADLRYPNGFAITLAPVAASVNQEP